MEVRVATRMGRRKKISATNSAEKLHFLLSPFEKETTAAQANTGLSVFSVFSMTKKYSPIFLFSGDQERENIDKSDDFLSVLLKSSRITIIEDCTGYIRDHVFLSRQ